MWDSGRWEDKKVQVETLTYFYIMQADTCRHPVEKRDDEREAEEAN
ncbi:hypothetical protein SOASR029_32220 [Budvicia aquatica]|nr:hypothetical protein SOASR029_32220 [Budvicia aquatica]